MSWLRRGDKASAAVRRTRDLLKIRRQEARSFAHLLLDEPTSERIGSLCSAIVAQAEGFQELAVTLFIRAGTEDSLQHAPQAFLSALIDSRHPRMTIECERVLQLDRGLDAQAKLTLACKALAIGRQDLAARFSSRAAEGVASLRGPERDLLASVQSWLEGLEKRTTPLGSGREPNIWRVGWWVPSAESAVPSPLLPPGVSACWQGLDSLPDDAWTLITDWRIDRASVAHFQSIRFRERCIVVSLQVAEVAALSNELLDMLRESAPVGAADETTAIMLRRHGVAVGVVDRSDHAVADMSRAIRGGIRPQELRHLWSVYLATSQASLDESVSSACAMRWKEAVVEPVVEEMRSHAYAAKDEPRSADAIEIALATDERLCEYLPVVLESLWRRCSLPVRAHVLTRGVPSAWQQRLVSEFAGVMSLVFYDAGPLTFPTGPKLLAHTTVSTLDRLILPELLALDRVLYLDVDLIVVGDLAPLWQIDLGDKRLAAKSATSPRARYLHQMMSAALANLPDDLASKALRRIACAAPLDARAFNAGVMLLNLKRMRVEGFARRFLPWVDEWPLNDQDVLNVYAAEARLELDPLWNAIPRQDDTRGAAIIHFAGPIKPWGDLHVHRAGEFLRTDDLYRGRTGRPARR